jgi:hypothetical protein
MNIGKQEKGPKEGKRLSFFSYLHASDINEVWITQRKREMQLRFRIMQWKREMELWFCFSAEDLLPSNQRKRREHWRTDCIFFFLFLLLFLLLLPLPLPLPLLSSPSSSPSSSSSSSSSDFFSFFFCFQFYFAVLLWVFLGFKRIRVFLGFKRRKDIDSYLMEISILVSGKSPLEFLANLH